MSNATRQRTKRTQPGKGGLCCGGCLSLIALVVVVCLGIFVQSGRYQPALRPFPDPPNPNALDDFLVAGRSYKANGGDRLAFATYREIDLGSKVALVEANPAALAQLRAGFGKPCGYKVTSHPSDYFPYLSELRPLGRLLKMEADVYTSRGEYGKAASSALDDIEYGITLQHGGVLMHAMTGTSAQVNGQSALAAVAEKLSSRDCDQAITRLRKLLTQTEPLDRIMSAERNYVLTQVVHMRPGDEAEVVMGSTDDPDEMKSPVRASIGRMQWHFAHDRTLKEIESYYDAAFRNSTRTAASKEKIPEPSGYASRYCGGAEYIGVAQRTELRHHLILVEIAISRYRMAHGSLPAGLDALGLRPEEIRDPFSGGPVVYKPKGKDYLLYGIGPDGKDDGGAPANEAQEPYPGDFGVRSFRFNLNATEQPRDYRPVPHMLQPAVPKGAPPFRKSPP